MNTAHQDIGNRLPVWEALSSLFLDTEVSDLRNWRAGVLAASPYSLESIEKILIDEVYPACKSNLYSVAGVWDGFDPSWLTNRILDNLKSPLRSCGLFKFGARFATKDEEWQATKTAIAALRKQTDLR